MDQPLRSSVIWRIFASSAGVFVAAGLALTVTPASISSEVEADQTLAVAVAVAVLLAIHWLLLRRTLRPLSTLVEDMRRVDVLQPGTRVSVEGSPSEVEELAAAFNDMTARLEHERRATASSTFSAIEEERRRIARDLHDQIGQDLTALLMQLDRMREHPEAAAARELTRDILDEVRGVVFELRPDSLDELGLTGALESMCSRLGPIDTVPRVTAAIDPDVPLLRREAQMSVYRVAQEALTNAVRHADAQTVALRLRSAVEPWAARLTVSDDGTATPERPGAESTGLRGMRERALTIGARVTITSASPHGTEVVLEIPEEACA